MFGGIAFRKENGLEVNQVIQQRTTVMFLEEVRHPLLLPSRVPFQLRGQLPGRFLVRLAGNALNRTVSVTVLDVPALQFAELAGLLVGVGRPEK
jgi:hypothetical protein